MAIIRIEFAQPEVRLLGNHGRGLVTLESKQAISAASS